MLPVFITGDKNLVMMQNQWSSMLNPLLDNAMTQGIFLYNVQLLAGNNQIDHKLGHILRGWVITRKRGPADIYDNQATNPFPQLTLTLNSSTSCNVDIYVF
jgi:hypothetical protein